MVDKARWFGESWGAGICSADNHAPTPVGQKCQRCGEPIESGDRGLILPYYDGNNRVSDEPYHQVCFLGTILPISVHRLREGFPLCMFTLDLPDKWPNLHYWSDRPSQVTCSECRKRQESLP
jgi:hypothetical protein